MNAFCLLPWLDDFYKSKVKSRLTKNISSSASKNREFGRDEQ